VPHGRGSLGRIWTTRDERGDVEANSTDLGDHTSSPPFARCAKAPMALATGARYHRTEFEKGPFGAGSPNVTLFELPNSNPCARGL
jgi:hypothetical protein